MKRVPKLGISLVIAGALLVGSSATPQAPFSERLQKTFAKAKIELVSYKECLKKRSCTTKQKIATAAAIGAVLALAALAVAGKLAYTKYAEEHELLPSLQKYIKAVRANLFSEKLGTITYQIPADVSRYPQQVIQKSKDALLALFKKIEEALKIGGSAAEVYEDLEGNYERNFKVKYNLFEVFGFRADTVYEELLGIERERGRKMSPQEINAVIKRKKEVLLQSKKYNPDAVEALVRQLGHLFRYKDDKRKYDAFLRGVPGIAETYQPTSKEVIGMQQKKYLEVPAIIGALP